MKVTPYPPRNCFKVDISAKATGVRRVREFFPTKKEANDFIFRCGEIGIKDAITEHRSKETEANNESPPDSAISPFSKSLGVMAKKFLGQKKKAKLAKETDGQRKYVLGHLIDKFGAVPIDLMEKRHDDLDEWLTSLPVGATTEYNHWRLTKEFFKWCQEIEEVVARNPMIKIKRQKPEAPKKILSLDEAVQGLRIAIWLQDSDIIVFLVLSCFCGWRSCEILRGSWEDIHWDDNETYVAIPKKTKKGIRPRWTKLPPVARAFLEPLRREKGKLIQRSRKHFYEALSRLWEEPDFEREARKECGPVREFMEFDGWPENCGRHSFATYHLAAFKEPGQTSAEMGHEQAQTKYSHYVKAMKQAIAVKWWEIHLLPEFAAWIAQEPGKAELRRSGFSRVGVKRKQVAANSVTA